MNTLPFLQPKEEVTYQCWVRYAHLPDEWIQVGGPRQSEYPSIKAFKAAIKKGNSYFNIVDTPERYAEIRWVKCTKVVTKEIVNE